MILSAYLRLLIFLPAILNPAYASSSPVFHIMYSAYRLNKQGDNISAFMYSFPSWEPVCFSISGSNCCFLTSIQVSEESGNVILYSHLLKNLPVVIYTFKGFGIVNEAEVVVFLEFSSFFYDPTDVGDLISGSSTFLGSF